MIGRALLGHYRISIHTPARGVTNGVFDDEIKSRISIHTPARGVTRRMVIGGKHEENFDPHPREGGDDVSFQLGAKARHFDPHPREGGDLSPSTAGI